MNQERYVYLDSGESEDDNGKDAMILEAIIFGAVTKPKSNSPSSSANEVASRLAENM